DVVAEDPEVQHVAGKVQEAAVQEHGGGDGGAGRHELELRRERCPVEEHRRDDAEAVHRRLEAFLSQRGLPEEHQHAGRDEPHGDHRRDLRGIVVVQGNHDGCAGQSGSGTSKSCVYVKSPRSGRRPFSSRTRSGGTVSLSPTAARRISASKMRVFIMSAWHTRRAGGSSARWSGISMRRTWVIRPPSSRRTVSVRAKPATVSMSACVPWRYSPTAFTSVTSHMPEIR